MGLGAYKALQTTSDIAVLLRELSVRLEKLEARMGALEGKMAVPSAKQADISGVSVSGSTTPTAVTSGARELMLAPVDEQIISLIRTRGHMCATDVQIQFKYKGKNAASARLSRLYELGLLEKTQAGRTVYYRMRSPD